MAEELCCIWFKSVILKIYSALLKVFGSFSSILKSFIKQYRITSDADVLQASPELLGLI